MDTYEKSLSRIANALEKIAIVLEGKLVNEKDDVTATKISGQAFDVLKQRDEMTLEEELFKMTTEVYLYEAMFKEPKELERKASARLNNHLMEKHMDFFKNYLIDFQIEASNIGEMIFIKKNNKFKAAVGIFTDLGWCRGGIWLKVVKDIVNKSLRVGINRGNIFFIVLSHYNGLDNNYTNKLLDGNITNNELLDEKNRELLEIYTFRYIDQLKKYLKKPHEQVVFLAGKLHPRVYAEALLQNNMIIDVSKYKWLSNSMDKMIEHIKDI
ncbi:MAG: hypothetical protein N4A64_13640 [Marinisporobacter sp.]|jgi:hypothetical protein|nr:hypothetical protein [Marinisporobacter sp.]